MITDGNNESLQIHWNAAAHGYEVYKDATWHLAYDCDFAIPFMVLTAFSCFLLQVTSAGIKQTALHAISRISLGYHRDVYFCGLQNQPPPVSGMFIQSIKFVVSLPSARLVAWDGALPVLGISWGHKSIFARP